MPVSNDDSSLVPPGPGRLARPLSADVAGWRRWLPGLQAGTATSPVGCARRDGRPRLDGDAGAGRHCLRRRRRRAGHLRLVRNHRPLLAYALFGPSRILVLGPDSSLAALILAVVLPLSGGDPMRAVALAGMMAVVSGLLCMVAGLLRIGFVTELLSKPIRYGYMNGIALTVLISQLPKLFGFSIDSEGPLRDLSYPRGSVGRRGTGWRSRSAAARWR